MDYTKVTFENYDYSYKKYFDLLREEKVINNDDEFYTNDTKLIFVDKHFAGFCRTIYINDELPDREISISLRKKFQGKGLAKYVLNTMSNNVFISDHNCEFVHLSIDYKNKNSLNMAKRCNFNINEKLTDQNMKCGNKRTIIFSKKNPFYKNENMIKIDFRV